MSVLNRLNIGVVGVCGQVGRGGRMVGVLKSIPPIRVHALCDIDAEGLAKANEKLGVPELYHDYDEMLDKSELDAVFIATPMDLHVPQSVAALRKGLHVLCEVTAAVSIEQCRQLVAAAKASKAVYMIGANYNYHRHVAVVREISMRGLFGTPYYAEGGYVADIKKIAELTPWRLKWQLGVNGIPYVTHNLGIMMQWMPGERVVAVCCSGSGHHYRDPRGKPYTAEDSCTMLGKTTSGHQVVIRSDFLSNGPGMGVYNDLQGTEGSYQSPRRGGDVHRIWLSARNKKPEWTDLAEIEEEFLPEYWKKAIADGSNFHTDHFQAMAFVDAITGKAPNPAGVHEAMDLTLPGLISQLSIADGGRWMEVPDSRQW